MLIPDSRLHACALCLSQVTYVAPMSGEYKVTLAVGTVTVAGSPFRVPCQQPRPSEHETTVDLRNGHGFLGEPYRAVVTVRDQFGQLCASAEDQLSAKDFRCHIL